MTTGCQHGLIDLIIDLIIPSHSYGETAWRTDRVVISKRMKLALDLRWVFHAFHAFHANPDPNPYAKQKLTPNPVCLTPEP